MKSQGSEEEYSYASRSPAGVTPQQQQQQGYIDLSSHGTVGGPPPYAEHPPNYQAPVVTKDNHMYTHPTRSSDPYEGPSVGQSVYEPAEYETVQDRLQRNPVNRALPPLPHQPEQSRPVLNRYQPEPHRPGLHQPGPHQPGLHQPGPHQPGPRQPNPNYPMTTVYPSTGQPYAPIPPQPTAPPQAANTPARAWLPWSVVNILCCICLGIPATVLSRDIKKDNEARHYEAARTKSTIVLILNIIAASCFGVMVLIALSIAIPILAIQ